MHTALPTRRRRPEPVVLCAVLALASLARAADTPRPDSTVVLSPFTVSTERAHGYQATDTITATGIGTKIRDVPVNISVLTPELMRDRGVDDVRWIANTVSGVNANTREFTAINIRGFEAPIQQDGFDGVFVSIEDAERVEVIKGPSAVFFGTNLPGGMMNVVKAKPKFEPAHALSARYGTYGSYRATLMSTGPLVADKLAYRVFASRRSEGSELDFSRDEVDSTNGSLAWKPLARVSIAGSAEYTDKRHERHHGFPVGHPAYIAAARAGQVPVGQAQRVWLDQNPLYGTSEPLGQVFMHKIVYPHDDFNTQGPDAGFLTRALSLGLNTDVNLLENLDLNVALNRSDRETEVLEWNSFRPVAGATPGTFYIPAAAAQFNQSHQIVESLKARLAWRTAFFGTRHSVVAGVDDTGSRTANRNYQGAARTFNPLTDPPRRLR